MRRPASVRTVVAATALLSLALTTAALAQEGAAPSASQIDEIIVTAEKWEQSANTVGMSIIAATGDVLQERGITSVMDLTRLVPGLTIQQSSFNSTSFTLRGVGFFNSDLATPPAVTIYVDEAPLPYPAMTKLVAFDLARVEVLEGPQGTLFGQNATGGAVNYIAAKPTDAFAAGVDATYGRFNLLQVGGFVSGPINDQLDVRIAVQGEHSDPWQESITRPGDELGTVRELARARHPRMATRLAVRIPTDLHLNLRRLRQSRGPVHRSHGIDSGSGRSWPADLPGGQPASRRGLVACAARHQPAVPLRQRYDPLPSELAERLQAERRHHVHVADLLRRFPHGLRTGSKRHAFLH